MAQAYATLSDSERRDRYDKTGRYEGDGGEEEFDMDEFFKEMFGGGGSGDGPIMPT